MKNNIIGKIITLNDGTKGKCVYQLKNGEYMLGIGKGCHISCSFFENDIKNIENDEKPDGNVKAELSCNVETCPSYRSGKCNGDKCIYRNDIKAYCLDEKIRGEVQQQRMDGEQ